MSTPSPHPVPKDTIRLTVQIEVQTMVTTANKLLRITLTVKSLEVTY